MKATVRQLINDKGDFVLTIGPERTAREALERMVEHDVSSIVVREDNSTVGILSDRDYIRRVTLDEDVTEDVKVKDIMTEDILVVHMDTTVEECMAIMTKERIRHLPVMENGELAGIISIGDCVNRLSEKSQKRIEALKRYIRGKYPG